MSRNFTTNAEPTYKIEQHYGTIGQPSPAGWTTELNMVSWNDKPPKFDIRPWSPDHSRCGKGITLTGAEMADLFSLIREQFEESAFADLHRQVE